ncbi:GIGYF family protein Gyf isoform X2 [Eurosta solidaginis]|uniref:GIGYF family protein Gyf isoform X2 n=1 Tax=Eurosta solidaginis TaxID=178769 RepID=UPI003530E982
MRMMKYQYEIYYTAGKFLVAADALSRHPVEEDIAADEGSLEEDARTYVNSVVASLPMIQDRVCVVLAQHLRTEKLHIIYHLKKKMTDSMKFGPEWLRNMSADNPNLSLLSNAGGSATLSNSGSLANNANGSSLQSFGMTSNIPSQLAYQSGPRNTFPEFRYGREEMLSLFDKKCNTPEILPKFKKIFVDKVQLPLALTPSTEDELISQVPPIPNRASWIQRSPVGFNNPSRGTGRGGSVDRGRIRGKSNYLQIYQRPTAMFDDEDTRSALHKIERGCSDRNGVGDSLNTGVGNICGFGLHPEWSDTPNSSPRKDFSNHPRNLENWRRSRNEDGLEDHLTNYVGNMDGWRGSNNLSNNFLGSHRWGRSTSWRDDDSQPVNTTDAGYGIAPTMQRSNSTITTVNERGCAGISVTKTTQSPCGSTNQSSSRTSSSVSLLNVPSVRKTQWNANTGVGKSSSVDNEDILPEWAMEYPSDGGGTFDASGAFHGSVEETDDSTIDKQTERKNNSKCENSIHNNEANNVGNNKSQESTKVTNEPVEGDQHINNLIKCANIRDSIQLSEEKVENSLNRHAYKIRGIAEELGTKNPDIVQRHEESILNASTADMILQSTATSPNIGSYKTVVDNLLEESACNDKHDLSDRMQKVADDMIEKLIMDDDTVISNNNGGNEIKSEHIVQSAPIKSSAPVRNVFMAVSTIVSPQNSVIQIPDQSSPTIAPTLANGGGHKGIQLYRGSLVIDHPTMHHHNWKQQQLAEVELKNLTPIADLTHEINSSNSTTTNADLWYYRDPQSKVQGPFTAIEMTEWYRAGYFNGNLYVRRLCDSHFRSLGELIKLCNDNMPFTHSHLLPQLETLNLADTEVAKVEQTRRPVADYGLGYQAHQHLEHGSQLKGNMNIGDDFVVNNRKGIMAPLDISSMHFQMLPSPEILVYNDLAANECFQQLTPSEKETVLQQKLQRRADFFRNVSVVNNPLARLSPSGGTDQFYDVTIDESKKDDEFSQTTGAFINATKVPDTTAYLTAADFHINSPPLKQSIPTVFGESGKMDLLKDGPVGTEILDNLGIRMFMSAGNSNLALNPNQNPTEFIRNRSGDLLTDSEFILAGSSFDPNSVEVQSWLPSIVNRSPIVSHQSPNEWSDNLLVSIPTSAAQIISSDNVIVNFPLENPLQQKTTQQQKSIQGGLWTLSMLHQPQSDVTKQEQPLKNKTKLETISKAVPNCSPKAEQKYIPPKDSKISGTENQIDTTIQCKQHGSPMVESPAPITAICQYKFENAEKQHNVNTKRIIKLQSVSNKAAKEFDDSAKTNHQDLRRDLPEDKRRQKEEKKRLQAEEKRQQQKTDEDKRRQMIEEREQLQIQGHRRKAITGGNITCFTNSQAVEQPRVQSSIAPWSSQINVAATSGPCLAEIQKAERRERQMEQRQVERVRSGVVATVETLDPMLKWNAPLKEIPVKSFAEIQAEEAKRSDELTEAQRRKEQEELQVVAAMTTNSNSRIKNISAIWSGAKVWGSGSITGFWEEPVKLSTDVTPDNSIIETGSGAAKVVSSCSHNDSYNVSKQAAVGNQKIPPSIGASFSLTGQASNQVRNPNARPLRKSQTLPAIKNTGHSNGKTSKNNQQNSNTSTLSSCNKVPQKCGGNYTDSMAADKKNKNQSHNFPLSGRSSTNKKEDYENEFNVWCTKSLSNMNTKLDGENKESSDFGKQFLERRSTYKNLQRAQNAHKDDMCKPAPAITPCHTNENCDYKGRQKKVKKGKMTKLDARILGFSVTAAEGRTNVGDRVYVDAP